MSLTVVQRFYEVAKQESEAPALGIECDGVYQELPWWFVKSKAKHFGLGLLEEGAAVGNYFYLFPSKNPNWIYAELGALTVGLKTVPLPAHVSDESLSTMIKKFPPAFFYLGNEAEGRLLPHHKNLKTLRRIILPSDPEPPRPAGFGLPEMRSFRNIFNSGIRSESRHHSRYREIRQSLHEGMVMSPIQVEAGGRLVEHPLLYGEVNAKIADLSYQCRNIRLKRLFSEVDLSQTMGRIAGLYWPIFLAIQFFPSDASPGTLSQVKNSRAQVALLGQGTLKEVWEALRRLSEKFRSSLAAKHWIRHQLRRIWGRDLKIVFAAEEVKPEDKKLLSMIAKIEMLSFGSQPSPTAQK